MLDIEYGLFFYYQPNDKAHGKYTNTKETTSTTETVKTTHIHTHKHEKKTIPI